MTERSHQPVGPDPGDEDRDEALRLLGRRLAIWLLPLCALGVMVTALGIPWWISAIAIAIAAMILIFEIEI